MELPESNVKFVCGLSNGESLVEGKGILAIVKGEDSPWWKLQKYLKERDLTINSFGLWTGDRHYNLPSKTTKFSGEIPISYNCFRKVSTDALIGGELKEHYVCAEAIYDNYKIQLWIDELEGLKSWVNIVNL